MLVSFSMENWASYKDLVTLSMMADKSRSHEQTLARTAYYPGLRILPVAAIYGGNASGKTNLITALQFVKRFVSQGRDGFESIDAQPFLLDNSRDEPTFFSVVMLVDQGRDQYPAAFNPTRGKTDEVMYRLDFEVDAVRVVTESLYWYDQRRNEHAIYERTGDDVVFAPEVEHRLDDKSLMLLNAAMHGMGERRLFLTNTADQKIPAFSPIVDWFRNTLCVADNSTDFVPAIQFMRDENYCKRMGGILRALGTGVESVGLERVSPDAAPLPEQVLRAALAGAPDDMIMQVIGGKQGEVPNEIYIVSKASEEEYDATLTNEGDDSARGPFTVQVQKVQTFRGGKPFGFRRESTGTRRLLQILPVFLDLWGHRPRVWALDEMEREFHTDLTRTLVTGFLRGCTPDSRAQMILSSHDLMLMDQDVFRKDEIFVAQREEDGVSELVSLGDYEGIRNDLDLRRSYLDGRFGGLPVIDELAFEEQIAPFEEGNRESKE